MPLPTDFYSPPPIEVAEMPWVESLPVRLTIFERVIPPGINYSELKSLYVGCFDELREAAVTIGAVALQTGLREPNAEVDIRSGMYDPRASNGYNVGFHYDLNINRDGPVSTCFIASGSAGQAAVGDIRINRPRRPESGKKLNPSDQQAFEAQDMGTQFDLSNADLVSLRPGVLYLLPQRSVHAAPAEFQPVGRNFFRFKSLD